MSNNMRIGGLATGMDIDKIVSDLMKAERMPLQKMEQDRTWLTYQRDAYREVNTLLSELDQMALDMKLDQTFNSKSATSTDTSAITATATPSASEGSYEIEVKQLATAAINVSQSGVSAAGKKIDPNNSLQAEADAGNLANNLVTGPLEFYVFSEEGKQRHEVTVNGTDSLNDVLKKITDQDNGVRAFYDSQTDKVVLERTETGNYNDSEYLGAEIGFDGGQTTSAGFFTETLQIKNGDNSTGTWKKVEDGGTNAKFVYNNALTLESETNSYTLNGITFNFTDKTDGNEIVSISNNLDSAVEKITGFVEKYNEVIEKINGKLDEERFRDYKPLTDKQREDMSEREIELWEEKSKSGLLRNDNILQNSVYNMRSAWYSEINTGTEFNLLSDIGIDTSSNFRDDGKLIIKEDDLKKALREDPDAVQKLFSNDTNGDSRGIINRLEDSLENTMSRLSERAGKSTYTFSQYTLGKRIDDLNDQIYDFEDRLIQVEDRYWNQFTQMEKAIQRMNQQSMFLMNQFGGGM